MNGGFGGVGVVGDVSSHAVFDGDAPWHDVAPLWPAFDASFLSAMFGATSSTGQVGGEAADSVATDGKACRNYAQSMKLNESERTTLMLRNLPNKFSREDVLELLSSKGFAGKFDFLYFPIDFNTHDALGYAFVNMVTTEAAEQLQRSLDGFSRWSVRSNKVCSVSWSQPLQGLDAHVARYRNSPVMHESVPDAFRPVLFAKGKRIPLPEPTKRIKPPHKGSQRMFA